MSYIHRSGDKRKSMDELDYEERHDDMHMSPNSPKSGHVPMESEKRLRREIANSNERRRMQSINAGFESLKTLIPHHREEKLSKAAILQQTSEYITNLESEKTRLLSQNSILRHTLKELNHNPDTLVGSLAEQITPQPATAPPAAKRKKRDTESSDEGISLGFDEVQIDELRKEVVELRLQLERERKLRQALENRGIPPPSANPPVVKTDLLPKREPATSPPPPAVQTTPAKPIVKPVVAPKYEATVTPRQGNTVLPPSAPLPPRHIPVFNSSMSKRNLDTIVEAIRHLEGEHILNDLRRSPQPLPPPTIPARTEDSSSSAISSDDSNADSPPPPPVSWPHHQA